MTSPSVRVGWVVIIRLADKRQRDVKIRPGRPARPFDATLHQFERIGDIIGNRQSGEETAHRCDLLGARIGVTVVQGVDVGKHGRIKRHIVGGHHQLELVDRCRTDDI